MTIGQRIKQARKSNSLSLRDLGAQVGISPMAISKYERDQDTPSSGVLLRIAQALEVNIDFFFRPSKIVVELQAYRKHSSLGVKEQDAIKMRIQEWAERYLEVESLFPDERHEVSLPVFKVNSLQEVEQAASDMREAWSLGLDPIENLIQLLEDKGIKVGVVSGFDHFDACTFMADGVPVIVTKSDLPGDRQRFNIGHELGHLVLDVQGEMDLEHAAHRFAAAFLVPEKTARFELGSGRTELDVNELYMLKRKYGLSMQAWIYRAKDLGIISENTAARLFQRFRTNNWHRKEPGEVYPPEKPMRMERLVYRALAEDMITRSRAQELLGEPLQQRWVTEATQQNDLAVHLGD
jgi:Zn-dependent peptidase ImmA (M78 family)/DNA-binding XRE family transcriptional regulator